MLPQTYTIRYYQGDDFNLLIYPKDGDGEPIGLSSADDEAYFRIADKRGDDATAILTGTASIIDATNGIPPAINATFNGIAVGGSVKNGYVYDIGYRKDNLTTTILTGTFSVIEKVAS
jgi:hypothetical protein